MKKQITLFAVFTVLTSVLTGCTGDEFMGISAFTESFNSFFLTQDISLSSYMIQKELYSVQLSDGEESVLLTAVTQDSGYIEEVRITASKIDSKGLESPVNEKRKALFISAVEAAVKAFTYCDDEQIQSVIREMRLNEAAVYSATGEKTTERGYFHLVYYSTELVSMLRIFNIHLHPTETTDKPESRPAFGNTTNIRTETVPLK